LTPPASAARTAPPDLPPASKPSALWLVSGVLAAIILLALGVGLKQWVAGGPPASNTSHAASGRPSTPYEATLRAEPAAPSAPAEPATTLVAPGASATAQPGTLPSVPARDSGLSALPQRGLPATPAAPKAARPAAIKRPALKVVRPAGAPEPKREAAAAGLPDNPY
jgi:hypothetical protein